MPKTNPERREMIDDTTGETAAVAIGYDLDGQVEYVYPDGSINSYTPQNAHPGNMEVQHTDDGHYYYAGK